MIWVGRSGTRCLSTNEMCSTFLWVCGENMKILWVNHDLHHKINIVVNYYLHCVGNYQLNYVGK